MAVVTVSDGLYKGLSTDTKPVAPAGTAFYETDTYDTHYSDGTYWWLVGGQNPFSKRRWGSIMSGTNVDRGTGMLSNLTLSTGSGSVTHGYDTTNGKYANLPTGTTVGNKGGLRVNSTAYTMADYNPRMVIRFLLPASTDYTLARLYIGLAEEAEKTGDTPLNSLDGFLVGFLSGGTNFLAFHNDGGATGDYNDNVAGSAQALDTALHTVRIVCAEGGTKWSVKWDANAYVDYITDVPRTGQNLTIHYVNETNETAVAKNIRVFTVRIQSDK